MILLAPLKTAKLFAMLFAVRVWTGNRVLGVAEIEIFLFSRGLYLNTTSNVPNFLWTCGFVYPLVSYGIQFLLW